MKTRHLIFTLILLALYATATMGQTLEEARRLYREGRYAEAKPTFERYVRSQPSNANYNFWYGVCCLMTGEPEKAVKPLELAVKRRVTGGRLYLGQTYHALYRYEKAVTTFEEYIADLTRQKKSTQLADSLLERSKLGLRLIRGVEQVCFIDSFAVPKADFLQAYHINPEAGRLHDRATFLTDGQDLEGTVFETELGDKIYYADFDPTDSLTHLRISDKTPAGWSESRTLPGLDEATCRNANYPYVLSDGATLYFAAEGENSLGGYDVFVTRYHSGRGIYLTPENVGMPFNSPANDYLYVFDEYNNLGWLASDRYQPADSVCIYVFIPNTHKQVYDYETTDKNLLIRLARIHAISETWTDTDVLAEAKARLAEACEQSDLTESRKEFEFVVNNDHVYTSTTDFRSPKALEAFRQYQQLQETYRQKCNSLADQRQVYAEANEASRRQLAPALTDLEKQLLQLARDINQTAKEVRRLENSD